MNERFEIFPGAKLGIARVRLIGAEVPAPTNHTAGVSGNGAMEGGSMKKLTSFLLCAAFTLCPAATAQPQSTVDLGSAGKFAVLAGTTVTNTGFSVINGDLGAWPGSGVIGFKPGVVNGTIDAGDAVAQQAQASLTIAYNDAAGRSVGAVTVAGNLGGQTLTPGLYKSTSDLAITGTLTLFGKGIYIFQIASALMVNNSSGVVLSGGAQAADVFWQVGSSATLGTTSELKGSILALTSISIATGGNLDGRALARNGAVTLDTNAVQKARGDGGVMSTAGIVNVASSLPSIAPGSLIAIYGSNLAAADVPAAAAPLPTLLGGTSVAINGTAIPLLFVSPGQINAQVPFELKPGTAKLSIQFNGLQSAPMNFEVTATGPGVFTQIPANPNHVVAVNFADGKLNTPQTPAQPGQYVTAYLTGQGAVDNAVPTGAAAPSSPLSWSVAPVQVSIGGRLAEVQFAGLAPGFAGLLQLNVLIPDLVTPGEQTFDVSIGGVQAGPTVISIGAR
jgi:uncharacterized protein (TIGR03437 family)